MQSAGREEEAPGAPPAAPAKENETVWAKEWEKKMTAEKKADLVVNIPEDVGENGSGMANGRHFVKPIDGKVYVGSVARSAAEFPRTAISQGDVKEHVKTILEENKAMYQPVVVRNLIFTFFACAGGIILLVLIGQILVHVYIKRSFDDGNVVNYAGRQRFLSQQISKASLVLHSWYTQQGAVPFDAEGYKAQLQSALVRWQRQHYGLWFGDSGLGLPKPRSQSVKHSFQALDPIFQVVYTAAQDILRISNSTSGALLDEASLAQLTASVATVLQNERVFLPKMDDIVNIFSHDSRKHQEFLLTLTWVFCSVTLFIVVLEYFVLLRPAIAQAQRSVNQRFGHLTQSLGAEATSRGVSRLMIAYLGHELEMPIQSITGAVQALLQRLRPHILTSEISVAAVREDLGVTVARLVQLDHQATFLSTVVSDVSNLRRLETGRMTLAVLFTDVAVAMQRAVSDIRRIAADKGVIVELEVDSACVERKYMCDETRLLQVLRNLGLNGVERSTPGSTLVVRATHESDERLRLEIIDGGPQLSRAEVAELWGPYAEPQSDDGRVTKEGRNRLGLYIAKMLASLQGGSIGADSKLEATSFWFMLPTSSIPYVQSSKLS